MPSYAIENLIPVVDPLAYVHPSAVLIGDVIIAKHCYIGPNAVLRGDFGRIIIKQGANIQDTCVVHSFPEKDCIVEKNGHIGHGAILHGCHIGENALVGMNAVIMDDAIIGAESLVAATAFVKSAFECPPRSLLAGSPATIKRQLNDKEVIWKTNGTKQYHQLTQRCQQSLQPVEPLSEIQIDRPRFTNSTYKPKHQN